MGIGIIGTGRSLPEKVLTNAMLSEMMDTSDEWIRTRTGISERHIMTKETLLDLATDAAEKALESAGTRDIGAVIFSTLQGDYISPSMSCLAAAALGLSPARVTDINMGCSGFLYALDIAEAYILAKKAKNVLIICAEAMSRYIDWSDRSVCVLFGDGAGAAVVTDGAPVDIRLTTSGSTELIRVSPGRTPSPHSLLEPVSGMLTMNGGEVYKFAVESVTRDITLLLEENGIAPDKPSAFLLHQANMRIIRAIAQRLGISEEKFPENLSRCGNTSSASLPMLLDETIRTGRIRRGDTLVLSAFGAGLATGAALLQF